jgi:hypothetical protein
MRTSAPVGAVLVLAALVAAGCGRRATESDCKLIVDKSVEVELKGNDHLDAAGLSQREQQVRNQLDEQIRSCEGRRVTDKTMGCVRGATTPEEIDKCLR